MFLQLHLALTSCRSCAGSGLSALAGLEQQCVWSAGWEAARPAALADKQTTDREDEPLLHKVQSTGHRD